MNNEQKPMQNGPEFWLSLDQYNASPEFAKRAETEFMSSPLASEDGKDGFARREFLKLMGASVAMATTACTRPVQHIIPYAQAPKDHTPGIPNYYASTWFDGLEAYGVLAKTLEGRPIKLEGNPKHPTNMGTLTVRGHAEIYNLYDPDRLQYPVRNLQNKTRTNRETIRAQWADLDSKVVEQLKKGDVAILSQTVPSPTASALIGDFTSLYRGRWVQFDSQPVDPVREANRLSFGQAVVPHYEFDQAQMVISIDCDWIGTYLSPATFMKKWKVRKGPGPEMARHVAFESLLSLTGMNADDRHRIRPSQQLDVAQALISSVLKAAKGSVSVPAGGAEYVRSSELAFGRLGIPRETLDKIGTELWAARGRSIVIAGGLPTLTEDALELQLAVNFLNAILGNTGKTIDYTNAPFMTRQGSAEQLNQLIKDMQAGKVKTLVIHALNAAYILPPNSEFLEALKKVEMVLYTGDQNDETGRLADYVVPSGVRLENWGDFEIQSGVLSIQQPAIRPLYETRSFEESLLVWAKAASGAPARITEPKDYYEYLRANWRTKIFPAAGAAGMSFEDFWVEVLQTGVVTAKSAGGRASASAYATRGLAARQRPAAKDGFELVLYMKPQIGDGKYANVAHMQECPDPVTKIVWDNYLMISPATARVVGLVEGDMVTVQVGERQLTLPAHIQPGMHDSTLAVAVGYGRTGSGRVAKEIGVNAYQMMNFNNGQPIASGMLATLKKAGGNYLLVSTQDHHVMEGRQLAVVTTKSDYVKNPAAGIHRHKIFSIWPNHAYNKAKWAMAIDLNACTGCSACVVACQAENNVPVVGKKYVYEGREMHWLRIDRYYYGPSEEPDAVFQPILCQHCETAPCETVCPVLATVHSDEGLNDMVYNRCVGTRYCSNNCPYKVRRFNWFNYSKLQAPVHMALNPDVTVRSRGVMEKCTFCVHRIRATSNVIRNTGLEPNTVYAEQLKTACQQTCPADAIVFGNLNDKNSAVYKHFAEERTYGLLEELNTQPRVRYMTRVKNSERPVPGQYHPAVDHGKDEAKGDGHGNNLHQNPNKLKDGHHGKQGERA